MKPLSKVDLQLYEVKRHIQNGHCRGQYEDEHGGVCLWGAINRVTTGSAKANTGDWWPVVQRLEAALAKRPWEQSLMKFNDTSTKEQVLGLVQEAIEAGS